MWGRGKGEASSVALALILGGGYARILWLNCLEQQIIEKFADFVSTNGENKARWMSLGAVSRMLGITGTTLRQWADQGRLPVHRTPGGHRRFMREDVEALMHDDSISTFPSQLNNSDLKAWPCDASGGS